MNGLSGGQVCVNPPPPRPASKVWFDDVVVATEYFRPLTR